RGQAVHLADDLLHRVADQAVAKVAGPFQHGPQHLAIARRAEELMGRGHRANDPVVLRLPRKDDTRRFGIAMLHVLEQRCSVHAGHAHVADDDVERLHLEEVEGGLAAGGELDLPTLPILAQEIPQPRDDVGVVHEQDALTRHAAAFAPTSPGETSPSNRWRRLELRTSSGSPSTMKGLYSTSI